MTQILRQSTQVKVVIGPAVAVGDGFTPVTTLDLSTADEAELLKHDAGSVTDISGATFAAITGADGYYNLTLTTSLTDTVGLVTVLINDDSLILPIKATFQVVEEAVYDRDFAASATGIVGTAQTGDSYALANGASGFVAIKNQTAAIETDTQDIQGRLPAALVSGRMDSNMQAAANDVITASVIAAGAIDRATFAADTGLQTIRSNTAQAGSGSSITLDASASAVDNFYQGCSIYLTGGTGAGQYAPCTAYNGTTKVATVTGWATSPDNTSTFAILPHGVALLRKAWDFDNGGYVDMAVNISGEVTVGTVGGSVATDIANEVAAELGTGSGLTALATAAELAKVPKSDGTATWNATVLASINAQCDTALADYDGPTNAEMVARTLAAASYATSAAQTTAQNDLDILTGTDGVTLATSQPNYAPATSAQAVAIQGATFDTATDSLEALRNRGDAAWTTATSVTVSDKTGFKLASDGLDTVATTAPSGIASNFREMVVAVWRHLYKKVTKSSTQIIDYADDGTTPIATRTISSSGSDQTKGAAS